MTPPGSPASSSRRCSMPPPASCVAPTRGNIQRAKIGLRTVASPSLMGLLAQQADDLGCPRRRATWPPAPGEVRTEVGAERDIQSAALHRLGERVQVDPVVPVQLDDAHSLDV